MRLSYFSIYLFCQYFNTADIRMHCYTLNEIQEQCLEGASNTLTKTLYMWVIPELLDGRVEGAWQGQTPSFQGLLLGCRVLPPAGCSAGLGARIAVAAAAVLSERVSMTQRFYLELQNSVGDGPPQNPKSELSLHVPVL